MGEEKTEFQRLAEEAIRKAAPDAGFPGTDTLASDHGCYDGWTYDEDGRAIRCRTCARQEALERADAQIRASGIGARYMNLEWDDLEMVDPLPRVRAACERIEDQGIIGDNALFHGNPGTGKTQAAVLVIKSVIRSGHTARLENLGRLAADIRAGYNGDGPSEAAVINELSRVDLLVLDDIGAGETKNAEVEQRILYLVLEARQNNLLTTIATTNLDPQALTKSVGSRIINRLMPLTTIAFQHGRNFRKRADGGTW